jgi:outer membrane beta-barrel protein
MKTRSLAITVAMITLISNQALSAELDASSIRGEPRDKVVGVVQNRYFTKSWRPNLAYITGRFLEEAYTKTTYKGGRMSLFPNEWIGFEIQSGTTTVEDAPDRTALNTLKYCKVDADCTNPAKSVLVSPDPEVNRVSKFTEYSLVGVPFYGKINIANQFLIYSDIYAVLGMGKLETDQGQIRNLIWGFGQRFYLNQYFNVQYDFRQRRWTEKRAGQDSLRTVWCLDLGIGAFLWK